MNRSTVLVAGMVVFVIILAFGLITLTRTSGNASPTVTLTRVTVVAIGPVISCTDTIGSEVATTSVTTVTTISPPSLSESYSTAVITASEVTTTYFGPTITC